MVARDADPVDWKIDPSTNAYLTIFNPHFLREDRTVGRTGTHGDTDDPAANPSKKPIQKWKPDEFEQYVCNLTGSAQRFSDIWLETPKTDESEKTFGSRRAPQFSLIKSREQVGCWSY